jgi:hypothetical protein
MYRLLLLCITVVFSFGAQAQNLPVFKVYTYHSEQFDQGGTEVHAYDPLSQRLFSTNAAEDKVDILLMSDLSKPGRIGRIDLSGYGGKVNSLAFQGTTLAVALQSNFPQGDGKILFFDTNGTYLNQLIVGAMPDMVTFSPSLQHILVANEGEPSDDYNSDPVGSVSIINFSSGNPAGLSQADVQTVSFAKYDTLPYDSKINIYGNNGQASFSQDVEPEYICFNANGSKAYVTLQENNALAIIDVYTASLDTVVGLGYKDWNQSPNTLDASDQSAGIKFQNYFNLFGLYQPDAICFYSDANGSYLMTANEGDARDYGAYSEEERINNVNLNPIIFNSPSFLQNDTVLGRLKVSTSLGNYNNPFLHDSLFTFGARSFSVWDTDGNLIWDSGDEFEKTLALLHPQNFNSDHNDNSSFKSRSDDKGPEPEAICTGEVLGSNYAFIGLERMGGIMIYNIDDPSNPVFDSYILDRDFSVPASDSAAGDLGPEFLSFIKPADSPNGQPLLLVSNEVSGTLSVYQLGSNLGIEQVQQESLEVYPNPSSGIFRFSKPGSFELYNSQGQKLNSYKNTEAIDLSPYPDGYYILRAANGSGLRILKK